MNFVGSNVFQGRKEGYIYSTREQGIGYYQDYKRKPEADDNSILEQGIGSNQESNQDTKRKREAVDEEVVVLTFIQVCKSIQKAATDNIVARATTSDPAKFMESELVLDDRIRKLKLYVGDAIVLADFVKNGLHGTLIELLSHPNHDIKKDVLEALVDFLEIDPGIEESKYEQFIDSFIEVGLLKVLVSNLGIFDEATVEGSHCVYRSMEAIECLVDFKSSLDVFSVHPTLKSYLIGRVGVPEYEANKLYASEILFSLVSKGTHVISSEEMESLLLTISKLRKVCPASMEEEECIANIFNSIVSLLMITENQSTFQKLEGQILMLKIIRHRAFCYPFATKILSQSIESNPTCAQFLVSVGGLKTIFPLFMEKGMKTKHAKKSAEHKTMVSESILSILFNLFQCLDKDSISYRRTLRKFAEGSMDKCDRLIEIYIDYRAKMYFSTDGLDPEQVYERRLDSGWEYFGYISAIIVYLIQSNDISLSKYIDTLFYQNRLEYSQLKESMNELRLDMEALKKVNF